MVNAPPPPSWSSPPPLATAEQIGPPAGFWIRFVAYIVDAFILTIALVVVGGVFVGLAVAIGGSRSEIAIGYLLAGFTSSKRALHDMMADTRVIKSQPNG